jgi:hypothetical protein
MISILISCALLICLFGGYVDSPDQPGRGLGN